MGSTMRPTIFNDRVANALQKWHHGARKKIKENKKSGHGLSPVHLLDPNRSNINSPDLSSLTTSNEITLDVDGASYPMSSESTCNDHEIEVSYMDHGMVQVHKPSLSEVASSSDAIKI